MTHRLLDWLASLVIWAVRLAPGLALLSLTVVADGAVAWAGLLGLIPLALAVFRVPGCSCGANRAETGFRSFPSY